MNDGTINKLIPLPKKSWDDLVVDTSDRDGGIAWEHCF